MADTPQPFIPLGHLDGRFFYYSFLLQRVIGLLPTEHRKENLFNLAPLSYWAQEYGEKKGSWEIAVDSLMQTCAAKGIFSPSRIIGRGIWILKDENGEPLPVIHYGDEVLLRGERKKPKELSDKYVFEAAEALSFVAPMKNPDFGTLTHFLEQLHFQTADAATFIAGWIVCGMAAGSLFWRPHLWITGRRGSGKSAAISFLRHAMGNCSEFYVGETTEAGIRQDLRHDCRAVIFDEAEPKNHAAQQKIQGVLNLLRQASSEDTGKIAKGTVSGKGMNFRIRSCACMGSINANLVESADKTRFTVIEMGEPMPKREFDKWKFEYERAVSPEFQSALHTYIGENILTLVHNAKIFSHIVGERLMENRAGDQYGTLLAGAYLLTSNKRIADAEALAWVETIRFPQEEDANDLQSDEAELWNYIRQRMIPFKKEIVNSFGSKTRINFERPLGELIEVAAGKYCPKDYAADDAQSALGDKGIKVISENGAKFVAVSNNHTALGDLIAKSRFAGLSWSPILRRLEGAIASKTPYRIGNDGEICRVTLIKINIDTPPIPLENGNVTFSVATNSY